MGLSAGGGLRFIEKTSLALDECHQSIRADALELSWIIGIWGDRAHMDYRGDAVGAIWHCAHCLPDIWCGDPWRDVVSERAPDLYQEL